MLERLRRRRSRASLGGSAARWERSISPKDRAILERAFPYTMTGVPRLHALIDAVRHLEQAGVGGAFAECGVWRGGSVLAMILTLQEMGAEAREIYLYDTFEGMTAPTERDTSRFGRSGMEEFAVAERLGIRPFGEMFDPQSFNEEAVRATILESGYPKHRLAFVRGPVEETLPRHAPDRLALLRLDTDWYESTWHELEHLYPLLASGGILIIDDYGHYDGCAAAVEEYFAAHLPKPFFARIDYSGRIAVKP